MLAQLTEVEDGKVVHMFVSKHRLKAALEIET